nr:hypothetical protein [Tanacetum cinerariifolium]
MQDVLMSTFIVDGLSAISMKIGNPVMLESYTCAMCNESWGMSSYGRGMVGIQSDKDLKESIVINIPNLEDDGYTCEKVTAEYEGNLQDSQLDEIHLVHQITMNLDNEYDEEDVQNVYDETVPSFKAGEYLKPKGKALPLIKYPMYSNVLWNIRGLNRTPKQNKVRQVINEHNLKVCAIIESHVDIWKLDRVCVKVCKNWKWTSNGSFYLKGSRIIIEWNDDGVDVMIMICMSQVIHTQVILKADQRALGCTFMYKANSYDS